MATIILFIAKVDSLPMYSDSNLYSFWLCIAMCSDRNMATVSVLRMDKGKAIAEKPNQIVRLDERSYRVASQSRDIMYDVVRKENGGWLCTCPDFQYRSIYAANGKGTLLKCKHIWAVEFSLKLRDKVKESVVIQPLAINACIYCKSENIKKDGIRHNRCGDIQIWNCLACGHYFTVNVGFERMRHNPQAVTTAMQLYFSGESLRNTARSLKLLGVQVTYQTVWNWIEKYTGLMTKYVDRITPQVSDTWRADELFLKVRGNMKYLYAMMDDETRYWIATEVANTKYTADLKPLFKSGKKIARKQPKTLITDGAGNFHEAFKDEFWTQKIENRPEHIQEIQMAGAVHNNTHVRRWLLLRLARSFPKEDLLSDSFQPNVWIGAS